MLKIRKAYVWLLSILLLPVAAVYIVLRRISRGLALLTAFVFENLGPKPRQGEKLTNPIVKFLEDNIVYPMVDLDPIFPTKQQKLLWTYKDQIIYDRKPERSPAPFTKKPYDVRLLELLHTLPQETQDKFIDIANNYADRYCEDYDIHLEEFRRIGYLRQLSKRVYCALNTKLYYDKDNDPQNVKDIFEISNYFHSKFTWMLNDNILQRSKGLNAPLEEIPL